MDEAFRATVTLMPEAESLGKNLIIGFHISSGIVTPSQYGKEWKEGWKHMHRAFLRSLGCPCPSINDWLGFGCFRDWIKKLTDNSCNCFLLRSGQLPLHLHRTTEGQQRRLRMWKSHWCDDGFARLLLLLQSRPGLEFGQSCFLGTFAWWWLFNRAKTRKIICDWVAWWTPPCFEYFVPFFVVIFYVISPTIAQIVVGPQSREGDSPHAHQWSIFIWDSRPGLVQGTVTEILTMCARTVYYCGHRMWQRCSSFFKWLLLVWLSLIKSCWLHKEAEGGISGEAGSSLQLVPGLRKWNLIGNVDCPEFSANCINAHLFHN